MHPLEKIQLPVHKENDLDDVPAMGRRMAGVELAPVSWWRCGGAAIIARSAARPPAGREVRT